MILSVIVPCLNEEANIGPCLDSLAAQDFSGEFEVLVVDNGSRDRTREIAAARASSDPRFRLIVEERPGTAAARNAGLRNAASGLLAFIDADCEAPPGWLSLLVRSWEEIRAKDASVAGVGGRNIASPSASPFVRAVEVALDSWFGSYTSPQGRQFGRPVVVLHVSLVNALYEKEALLSVGGFDDSLRDEAEDAEINFRLAGSGRKLLFVPESFVWHKFRASPRAWFRNMFRYGKGRARLLKRHRSVWALPYLLPLFFLAALAAVPLALWSPVFFLPLLYFPLILAVAAAQAGRRKAWPLFGRLCAVYILLHVGYAAGELAGLVDPRVH
jgi:cellulose synthase/poly-beta-1,6-N-acetylglucosamine synthase-like glycosyltransferase